MALWKWWNFKCVFVSFMIVCDVKDNRWCDDENQSLVLSRFHTPSWWGSVWAQREMKALTHISGTSYPLLIKENIGFLLLSFNDNEQLPSRWDARVCSLSTRHWKKVIYHPKSVLIHRHPFPILRFDERIRRTIAISIIFQFVRVCMCVLALLLDNDNISATVIVVFLHLSVPHRMPDRCQAYLYKFQL